MYSEFQPVVDKGRKPRHGFPRCLCPADPLPRCSRHTECPHRGPGLCLRPFGVKGSASARHNPTSSEHVCTAEHMDILQISKRRRKLRKKGILWPRISKSSVSCTGSFIPQWKLTEGTALFSNTKMLVLSIIAAADKFILVDNLLFAASSLLAVRETRPCQDHILPRK
ncbi:hypothetical protein Y032_0552g3330 [Ancylostoma ceylanicum]|uniref:Uncharacterized protein n=1 Tax=Ancylostoma ceylanicum TaxID=53326 RepID=A0A016WPV7_9BILA|nr:hypothetical protein Y032_0552g3330 [Ancylostoma ceylanicum]